MKKYIKFQQESNQIILISQTTFFAPYYKPLQTNKQTNFSKKAFLLISGIPTSLTASLLAPSMKTFKKMFPERDISEIKQINSVASLLLGLTAPVTMLLVQKLQKYQQTILLVSLLIYTIIGTAPFFFCDNYILLIVFRVFLGLFNGITEPLSLSMLVKHLPPEYFGYRAALMSFLGLVINVCGGVIVDECGVKYLFLVYLINIVLVIFICFTQFGKDDQKKSGEKESILVDQKKSAKNMVPDLIKSFITAFFSQLSYFIIPSSLSLHLGQMGVTSATYTGVAVGLSMFSNGIVSLFYKQLLKLFKQKYASFSIACLLSTGAFMSIFGFIKNYYFMCFILCICSVCMGNQMPNYNAWTSSIVNSPVTMGINSFCTFFSHFLTPYIYCFEKEELNILLAGVTQIIWGVILSVWITIIDAKIVKQNKAQNSITKQTIVKSGCVQVLLE